MGSTIRKRTSLIVSLILALALVLLESMMAFDVSDRTVNVIYLTWLITLFFIPQISSIFKTRRYLYLILFLVWVFLLVLLYQGVANAIIKVYKLTLILSPILMYDVYKGLSRGASITIIICFIVLYLFNSSVILSYSNLTDGYGMRYAHDEFAIDNSIASSISLALIIPVLSFFLFNPIPINFKIKKATAFLFRVVLALSILAALFVLYKAAFITQLLIGLLGVIWGACYRKKRWKTRLLVYSILPVILFMAFFSTVMTKMGAVDNAFVLQEKLSEVFYVFSGQKSQAGDYEARSNRALLSLETFSKNPITGVVVESKGFEDQYSLGVGNHSEWVDCLALYGIAGILLLLFIFLSLKEIGRELDFKLFFVPYFVIGCLNPILSLPQNATAFLFIPTLIRYYLKK